MLIGPQGPPWWIFFQKFLKNVLVYPQLTQKYVLWHSKMEKSILGRRELRLCQISEDGGAMDEWDASRFQSHTLTTHNWL